MRASGTLKASKLGHVQISPKNRNPGSFPGSGKNHGTENLSRIGCSRPPVHLVRPVGPLVYIFYSNICAGKIVILARGLVRGLCGARLVGCGWGASYTKRLEIYQVYYTYGCKYGYKSPTHFQVRL